MAFNSIQLGLIVLNVLNLVVVVSLFFYLAHEDSKPENDQLEQKDAQKVININVKTLEPLIASPTISPTVHGTPTSSLTGTFTGSRTGTAEFQAEQPKKGLNTRAVIHMGVHKTGTTSIQHTSRTYQESLKKDGYEMPWVGFTEHWGIRSGQRNENHENQVPFAACFVEPNGNRCVPEILQEGTSIAQRHKNIFVSTELFSRMEPNDIKKLSKYLNERWDLVTIIVYYRRYYDYLRSVFDERHKNRRLINVNLLDSSLLDFLLDEIEHGPTSKYIFPLVSRLKQHVDNTRNNTNIVVMNFHDRSMDLSERFYCEAIPDAYHTCEDIHNSETSIHANSAVCLGYASLAYAACKANLVHASTKAQRDALDDAVKKHQEETLGLTRDDFKLKCLPLETLQRLLNKSLEYEKAVLPELDGSDLRADFEKQAASKLCVVDVEFTLSKPEWKNFFKNYTQ